MDSTERSGGCKKQERLQAKRSRQRRHWPTIQARRVAPSEDASKAAAAEPAALVETLHSRSKAVQPRVLVAVPCLPRPSPAHLPELHLEAKEDRAQQEAKLDYPSACHHLHRKLRPKAVGFPSWPKAARLPRQEELRLQSRLPEERLQLVAIPNFRFFWSGTRCLLLPWLPQHSAMQNVACNFADSQSFAADT